MTNWDQAAPVTAQKKNKNKKSIKEHAQAHA
jgi:hypothetical protein